MSEPKESDIAFAKKIAPDLARGMQTYDEYIARGEELGVLARAYKRKWDDLLAGIAAYREELEARTCEACQFYEGCEHQFLHKPAPAQSREEEADPMALPREIASGMSKFISMVRDDEGGVHGWNFETEDAAQWISSQLAALRSHQSPQAVAIDDIFRIDAVVEASEESAAKCSWRRIKGAIVAPRPSAAPQPSPQSKTLDQLAKEQGVKPIDDIASLVVPGLEPDFLEPSPQGEDAAPEVTDNAEQCAQLLTANIQRKISEAMARGPGASDSEIREIMHDELYAFILRAGKKLDAAVKEADALRSRLASAQSSAQGEGAREIVAARDEEWKAWIKAKGFNLEPLAGCL